MKNEYSISVIIPVYNVEKYLTECIESVLHQNLNDMEIILVNDGSTDRSGEICRAYAERYADIVLIEKDNGGLSSARNAGFLRATGRYIYFLDSDDYIEPDCLAELYACAEKEQLEVLFFAAVGFCGNQVIQPQPYRKEHCYASGIRGKDLFVQLLENKEYTSSVPQYIVRRASMQEYKLSFAEGILHEDELFTFLLLQNVKRAGVLNRVFYHRRYRSQSITQSSYNIKRFCGYAFVCREMICYYKKHDYTVKQRKAVEGYILSLYHVALLTEISLTEGETEQYKKICLEMQEELKRIHCCHRIRGYVLAYCLSLYRNYLRLKKNVKARKYNS